MPTATKSVRTRGPEKRGKYFALRLTQSEYDALSARAQHMGISMTEFMVKSALGELEEPGETDARLRDHERRIAQLERLSELAAGSY